MKAPLKIIFVSLTVIFVVFMPRGLILLADVFESSSFLLISIVFIAVLVCLARLTDCWRFLSGRKRREQKLSKVNEKKNANSIITRVFVFENVMKNLSIWASVIFLVVIVGLGAFGLVSYLLIPFAYKILISIFITILVFGTYIYIKFKKNMRIMKSSGPDEKIKTLNETFEKSGHKNPVGYYSELSVCYFEKGDYEQALELAKQAKSCVKESNQVRIDVADSMKDIIELNTVSYLLALERTDEAALILDRIDNGKVKEKAILFIIKEHRANVALLRNDTNAARFYINELNGAVFRAYKNQSKHRLLLLQAKCDLADGDKTSAIAKLDEIIGGCTYLRTLNQAKELRDII